MRRVLQTCRPSIAAAEVADDDLVPAALPYRYVFAAFPQGFGSFAMPRHAAFALRAVRSAFSQIAFHAAKITAHAGLRLLGLWLLGESREDAQRACSRNDDR
jgi:hypothetical protein